MFFLKKVLPNLSIAFGFAVITIAIFNNRNPMMGFLLSKSGTILLIVAGAVCAVSSAVSYILLNQKKSKYKHTADK